MARHLTRTVGLCVLTCVGATGGARAQPAATVRYTEARILDVDRTIRLTGSVESHRTSVVASQVAGVVAELAAREGDGVGRGQVLVRLDTSDLELRLISARGQLEEAQARLRLAEANLERFQGLFADQVVSRQQLDDAATESEAWRGRKTQLEAEVARLDLDLKRSAIRAPFAGVVVREHTTVGEWLGVGDPASELLDLDSLEVTIEVPERTFADLRRGAPARVTFEGLGGLAVDGEVRAIVPRADPQARSFPVKVAIANPEGRIGVGMLAQVELPVGSGERALMVPKDAVLSLGATTAVWVIGDAEKAQRVDVDTGASRGAWVAVEGDLQPGARVITRGNERLFPGQQVRGEPLEYETP